MRYSPETARRVLEAINDELKADVPADLKLQKLWWRMMSINRIILTKDLRIVAGDKVCGGPFKGMKLTDEAIGYYQSPILLGCYEHELHPAFEKIIARPYTRILNIGCSVGYYAVGLALRMPHAVIEAFDIDPEACRKCADMATLNNVQDRVHVSGEFRGEDFARYADEKTLVLVDIEGAEKDLLDPGKYPGLSKMDVVVELHDLFDPSISPTLLGRFSASHTIDIIQNENFMPKLDGILKPSSNLTSYEQMLLGWESRDGETPWGIFWSIVRPLENPKKFFAAAPLKPKSAL